jgi:hypothetical protein
MAEEHLFGGWAACHLGNFLKRNIGSFWTNKI